MLYGSTFQVIQKENGWMAFFFLKTVVCVSHYLFNLFDNSSEVKTYDPSGESTLPLVPKKRKIVEVEETTTAEEEEVEVVPSKKQKAKVEIKG